MSNIYYMDRQNNQDEIDILTRTATQPLCFASQARMHSGRASGSHPSANVDMPSSIDKYRRAGTADP